MIYSIIDAYFIGRLNNTAMMSAVILPFTTILMAIGNIFGTGGGTYITRLLGEKKIEEAKKVSSVTIFLSLLAGCIFMLLTIPLIGSILQLLGAKGDTVLFTQSFIMTFIIGSPFVIANFVLEQVVRAEGASTVSMNGLFLSVIINIVLDPILIFACHLGIVRAAIGTVVAKLRNVQVDKISSRLLEEEKIQLSAIMEKLLSSIIEDSIDNTEKS